MTTVVYSKGIMCADTQVVENGMRRLNPVRKIHLPENNEVWKVNGKNILGFGFSGTLSSLQPFKEYLKANMTATVNGIFTDDNDFSAIIVDSHGDVYTFNHKHTLNPEDNYSILIKETDETNRQDVQLAIGSGRKFALAALVLGEDHEGAVALAIKLDVYSGGDCTTYNFNKHFK